MVISQLFSVRSAFVAFACLVGGSVSADAARVEKNVWAPMRDGVRLMADVYRPDVPGNYPVLLVRTPYGRKGANVAAPYVAAGYIVVCQDARGRYDSEGEFLGLVHEKTHDAEDGYDSVEWAARLPESTGKVGTFGLSYDAFLQWRLAALQPPSLAAMAASSIPARMLDVEGPGTIRPGRRLMWYHGTISPDLTVGADVSSGVALRSNSELAFMGAKLVGDGFIVTHDQARSLGLGSVKDLDRYIKPFRNGRDLTEVSRGAWSSISSASARFKCATGSRKFSNIFSRR